MENIKEVAISYENCEVFTVPKEYVKWFYMSGISESWCFGGYDKDLSKYKMADKLHLTIYPDANNDDYLWMNSHLVEEEKIKPFCRTLEFSDIVAVYIHYEDGTKESVYVHWEGDNDYVNPAQYTYIDDKGNLVIEVKKGE